jgi:RsiW-degrading membrane proteinase PrsW (M82 family)
MNYQMAAAAVVPVLFFFAYAQEKVHASLFGAAVLRAFRRGLWIVLPAIVIELALTFYLNPHSLMPYQGAAVEAGIAALPEETLKLLGILFVARRFGDARHPGDIILLSVGVSLGFALLENVLYLLHAADWQTLALARGLTAVPAHGMFGLMMGVLIVGSLSRDDRGVSAPLIALVLPTLAHAAYDFILVLHQLLPFLAWPMQVMPWLLAGLAGVTIVLCDTVLPRAMRRLALREDVMSAVERGPLGPTVIGIVLLIVGLGVATVMMFAPQALLRESMATLCALPVMFGLDMLATAVGRIQDRGPSSYRDEVIRRRLRGISVKPGAAAG